MKVALFGTVYAEDLEDYYIELLGQLNYYNIEIVVYKPYAEILLKNHLINAGTDVFENHADLAGNADLVFSVGGDGTLLRTIPLIRDSGIPVLGFNTGRLGFLSGIAREEITDAVESLLNGKFQIEPRSMISLNQPGNLFGDDHFALNEISIHKYDSSMITIHAYINDVYLNSYWADGLIIATPTGSTAYSLSCGGPILTPDSKNIIITPIATHNLTVRPIVIPDDSRVKLRVEGRCESFLIALDSQNAVAQMSTEVEIARSPVKINLVQPFRKGFFTTIREKLMWGIDKRN